MAISHARTGRAGSYLCAVKSTLIAAARAKSSATSCLPVYRSAYWRNCGNQRV
jgi:hypothetical protein